MEGKVVTISDDNGEPREFSASSVKLFTTAEENQMGPENGQPMEIMDGHDGMSNDESELSERDDVEFDPDYK